MRSCLALADTGLTPDTGTLGLLGEARRPRRLGLVHKGALARDPPVAKVEHGPERRLDGAASRTPAERGCATPFTTSRRSATPPRCGASRSTLELDDQEGVWFGHYDLNDFRFLGVRKRKLAEERRKAAVPGR